MRHASLLEVDGEQDAVDLEEQSSCRYSSMQWSQG